MKTKAFLFGRNFWKYKNDSEQGFSCVQIFMKRARGTDAWKTKEECILTAKQTSPPKKPQNSKPKANTTDAVLACCFGEIRKQKTRSMNWKK